jgi:hypothetical protein
VYAFAFSPRRQRGFFIPVHFDHSFIKAKVMLARLFRRIWDPSAIYAGHFIEVKALYSLEFDAVCCIRFIGDIDVAKAFALINDTMQVDIIKVYQHAYFDHDQECVLFNNTIFVMADKRIIELGSNYCQVLHGPDDYKWANDIIASLVQFRVKNTAPAIGFTRQAAEN